MICVKNHWFTKNKKTNQPCILHIQYLQCKLAIHFSKSFWKTLSNIAPQRPATQSEHFMHVVLAVSRLTYFTLLFSIIVKWLWFIWYVTCMPCTALHYYYWFKLSMWILRAFFITLLQKLCEMLQKKVLCSLRRA